MASYRVSPSSLGVMALSLGLSARDPVGFNNVAAQVIFVVRRFGGRTRRRPGRSRREHGHPGRALLLPLGGLEHHPWREVSQGRQPGARNQDVAPPDGVCPQLSPGEHRAGGSGFVSATIGDMTVTAEMLIGRRAGLIAVGVCRAEPFPDTTRILHQCRAEGSHAGMQFTSAIRNASPTRPASCPPLPAWSWELRLLEGRAGAAYDGRPCGRVAAYARPLRRPQNPG